MEGKERPELTQEEKAMYEAEARIFKYFDKWADEKMVKIIRDELNNHKLNQVIIADLNNQNGPVSFRKFRLYLAPLFGSIAFFVVISEYVVMLLMYLTHAH